MDQSFWKEQLYKYRTGSLTSAEEELLWDALADPVYAEEWKQVIGEMFREQAPGEQYQLSDWEPVLQAVFNSDRKVQPVVVRRIPMARRIVVAAAVAGGLLVGGYWLVTKYARNDRPPIVQSIRPTDIAAPTANRARITLASGQQVYLDSAASGALAQQAGAQVVKEANGQVAYNVEKVTNQQLLFNTLTNPRGSRVVTLTLSDGTKVWLNAESSIRYPAVFVGSDRTVEMTGEAYFEVAANASKPFNVRTRDQQEVEVLGTSFNINAYGDEPVIKTTLLDGSVRVVATPSPPVVGVNTNNNKLSVVLRPGQQVQFVSMRKSDGRITVDKDADVQEVMAWKNGRFAFRHADLPSVMRQLARWYDVDVSYEGTIPDMHFSGRIGSELSLNQVLKILTSSRVQYRIDSGNKLIIRD